MAKPLHEKAEESRKKRETPVSLGKNSAANSFVPVDDEPEPPSLPQQVEPLKMGPAMDGKAEAQTQNGLPSPTEYAEQQAAKRKSSAQKATSPFSDMLAPFRESIVKEKTDALKMQKYHALADVFNALGKMGGAAVGGAIGGNMLDSAPTVGEYKESRGYLDAFERAKQANERLRDLDAKEFQLAYDQKKRDEERAYNDKVRKEDREYKAQLDKENKEWQKTMIDYKSKIEQAAAAGNLKLKAQLESEAQAAAWQHQLKRDALLHGYDMDEKRLGQETIKLQKELYADKDSVPFAFNDGTARVIPKSYFNEMLKYYAQKGNIGGVSVDADNVADVLRDHPNLVNDFMNMFGKGTEESLKEQPVQTELNKPNEEKEEEAYYYTNPITNKSIRSAIPMNEYKESTTKKKESEKQEDKDKKDSADENKKDYSVYKRK